VEIDVCRLLALPAADRLALADMLRTSVGYPANIDALSVPAWQRDHMDRLLKIYSGDSREGRSNDLCV
jgi:hypothetical protein